MTLFLILVAAGSLGWLLWSIRAAKKLYRREITHRGQAQTEGCACQG